MYYVYELNFDNSIAGCKSIDCGSTHTFGFIDLELMQYTGVNEFFENEIFDGDIVFLDSKMMIGKIESDGISWRIKFEKDLDWLCDYHEDLHVIGNIHENPDLLNTTEE